MVPGTKMIFPGLPNEQDRQNVIAYLETFGPDGQKKNSAWPACGIGRRGALALRVTRTIPMSDAPPRSLRP